MAIDMAQFHQVFFEESFEGLDVMESGLLHMDLGAVDPEQINAIFRAAHSIKGGSGTFGFTHISTFTHVMETLLDQMRDGRRPLMPAGVDLLLRSVDVLRMMLTAAQNKLPCDEARVIEQKAALDRFLQGAMIDPSQAQPPKSAMPVLPVQIQPTPSGPSKGWHIVFRPLPHMMRSGNDPLRILWELADLGDLKITADTSALPRLRVYEPEDCCLSWNLLLHGEVSRAVLDDVFAWVEDECDLAILPLETGEDRRLSPAAEALPLHEPVQELEPARQPPQAAEPPLPVRVEKQPSEDRATGKTAEQKSDSSPGSSSSIRVDIQKIDTLINMVGELVITQSMLGLLGQEFEMNRLEKLRDGLAQLERHTRELQEGVMQIRMLPISFTFNRFPRLVHDLSAQLGKQVELRMSGENTEVDKTVIEKIGDPLVHLVRNSLDHGIESPEARRAAGKSEVGRVDLNAYHRGGNIVIEVMDDGAGIDSKRLIQKAMDRGLLSPESKLTEAQAHELIFLPGFSTAQMVSDVSGRGVGMDVVRRNINELGGNIDIVSKQGKGTRFIIRLPLTLAILDGQTIAVGSETYIVPLVSIVESIQIRHEMVNLVAGKGETFKLRDEYLSIVRLHEVFDIPDARARQLTEGLLVVVEGEGRRCGLFVDDLQGQQQVVIKSLEQNYGKVDGISGATILGNGSVALILDIPGLIRLARGPAHPANLRRLAA
ncbi:Chemotaxis protein CheA [Gammaproteobacteria bacterium]